MTAHHRGIPSMPSTRRGVSNGKAGPLGSGGTLPIAPRRPWPSRVANGTLLRRERRVLMLLDICHHSCNQGTSSRGNISLPAPAPERSGRCPGVSSCATCHPASIPSPPKNQSSELWREHRGLPGFQPAAEGPALVLPELRDPLTPLAARTEASGLSAPQTLSCTAPSLPALST